MGAIAASITIAERDGARITGQKHRQPHQDGGNGQVVNNLLPRKGLVDQLQSSFGDPRLCSSQQAFYYYIVWLITTHYVIPEGSSLISWQSET